MKATPNREAATDGREFEPLRALVHPLWLGALAVLLLNDHVLKGALEAPLVTGKLSDVAGLIVAPAALAAILRVRDRRTLWICAGAVAAVFAAINLFPAAANAWDAGVAVVFGSAMTWTDPADLLTLPAAAAGVWVLAPAMKRPLPSVGPRTTSTLAAVAAVACLGSTGTGPVIGPEPEPRPRQGPNFSARVALLNQTHELQALRIRHLANGVDLDCERIAEAPHEYLTDEVFGSPTRWELFSGQQVGLGGAGQSGRPDDRSSSGCRAASIALPSASDIIVFWSEDLPVKTFSANPNGDKNELGGPQVVELTGDYSDADSDEVRDFGYRPCREDNMCSESGRRQAAEVPEGAEYEWNRNDDQQLFWETLDRNARNREEIPKSCLQPVDHPGLTWSNLPSTSQEVREVVRGADGCHELELGQQDAPALLCAPWNAVSQLQPADGETRIIETLRSSDFGADGGSVESLRISVRNGSNEALGSITLSYGVPGPPLPRSADVSIPVGCGPQPQSCGRVDLPARLEFPGIETAGPVGVGREFSLGNGQGRVRLVRSLYRAVARPQTSCASEEDIEETDAPRETEALEGSTGVYLEAVTTKGFDQ